MKMMTERESGSSEEKEWVRGQGTSTVGGRERRVQPNDISGMSLFNLYIIICKILFFTTQGVLVHVLVIFTLYRVPWV